MISTEKLAADCFPPWLQTDTLLSDLDNVFMVKVCQFCYAVVMDGPLMVAPSAGTPPRIGNLSISLSGHVLYHQMILEELR